MLVFVTPPDAPSLLKHWDEFRFLHQFIEKSIGVEDFREVLLASVGEVSLVYYGGVLLGCFIIEPFSQSVELHGIARQDMKLLFGRQVARRLLDEVYQNIFKRIFLDVGKERIVAKVFKESKGGLGFVRRFGFEKLPNTDKGRTVWKLTRAKYLRMAGIMDGEE